MRAVMLVVLVTTTTAYADKLPDSELRHPPGATLKPCEVTAEVTSRVVGKELATTVKLVNLTTTPQSVQLRTNCGRTFSLRSVYASQAQVCAGGGNDKTYKLGSRAKVTLGTQRLPASWFALGSTMLVADLSASNLRVCSAPSVHVIRDLKTKRLRVAKLSDPQVVQPD